MSPRIEHVALWTDDLEGLDRLDPGDASRDADSPAAAERGDAREGEPLCPGGHGVGGDGENARGRVRLETE